MNDTNNIKRTIIAIVGMVLALYLVTQIWKTIADMQKPDLTAPAISVSGEGKIFVKPDIGQVQLAVIAEATTVGDAQKKATDSINKVFDALKNLGVEEKDIKSTSYSIQPKYDYSSPVYSTPSYNPNVPPRPSEPRITGYTVSQSLEVKIRDTAKAGDVLAKAAAAGANQIGGLTFTTEDPTAVQAEARNKAIEDANKKAKELESRLGIHLGKIIGFNESGGPYPIYRDYAFSKGAEVSSAPAPQIPLGENEVTVNVTITYQIK